MAPAHTEAESSGFSSESMGNGLHPGQMEPRRPEPPACSSLCFVESESLLYEELRFLLISFRDEMRFVARDCPRGPSVMACVLRTLFDFLLGSS